MHVPNCADVVAERQRRQEDLARQVLEDAVSHMRGGVVPGSAIQFSVSPELDETTMRGIASAIAERGWSKVGFFRQVTVNHLIPGELPELFLTFTAPPL